MSVVKSFDPKGGFGEQSEANAHGGGCGNSKSSSNENSNKSSNNAKEPEVLSPFLRSILDKVVVVGLAYFDTNNQILQQRQVSGTVVRVTANDGITLRFRDGSSEFNLPSDISCWFKAPKGSYSVEGDTEKVIDPEYLVTWNVCRVQDMSKKEGEHEWWEWRPNTISPSVG